LVLGESAFWYCSSLRSICLPSSLETISPGCFQSCGDQLELVLATGNQLSAESRSHVRDKLKFL
jgi:hypothetical protein